VGLFLFNLTERLRRANLPALSKDFRFRAIPKASCLSFLVAIPALYKDFAEAF